MLKLRHFTISQKLSAHLDFDDEQNVSKKLGQGHVSHCAASLLLLTTSVNIWNWGDQLLDLWERNVVPFLSDRGFLGLLCCIWNVFRWWNIWTAGRSVQQLDPCTTKPCCWNRCRMWFNFVLLKYAYPWRRRRLDGSRCCSKTRLYLSALMEHLQMCKAALMHPHTIRDAWYDHLKWPGVSFLCHSLF